MTHYRHIPNDQLQWKLFELGYDVPSLVVRSWAGEFRHEIEGWVRFRCNRARARQCAFPQCLAQFDISVLRFKKGQHENHHHTNPKNHFPE